MYKRSIDTYLIRMLKRMYPSKYLLQTSKVCLSQYISVFCSRVIKDSLLYSTPNTVLSVRVLKHVLSSYLCGGMLSHSTMFGDECITYPKHVLKETLVVPVSFIRHTVVGLLPQHVKVSSKYYTFLCAVIEYMCHEIIDLSVFALSKRKQSRIRPEDILDAIHTDTELWYTTRKLNIVFLNTHKKCYLSDRCVLEILKRIDSESKYSPEAIILLKRYLEHTVLNDVRTRWDTSLKMNT